MKIVILDGYEENPGDLSWEEFEKLGDLTVYDHCPENDTEEILRRIGDAEIVISNKTPLTAEAIERCPNLKYIGVLATGYNVIDTETASRKKIPVTNIPAYGTAAVAQYTMALLLEICHQIGHHSKEVAKGRWGDSPEFCFWDYPLIELAGKTMGIIGFGRIGQATARLAEAFGMKILVYSKHSKTELLSKHCRQVSLPELLANSDVVSLHCPLFPDTAGLICRETIQQMKDGAILLNTARGQLVVEDDLAEALKSGKIYAAALDVVAVEPIQKDNPLLTAPNCLITPHIAWAPKEARQRLMDTAVDNLRAFLDGSPVNVVNRI